MGIHKVTLPRVLTVVRTIPGGSFASRSQISIEAALFICLCGQFALVALRTYGDPRPRPHPAILESSGGTDMIQMGHGDDMGLDLEHL